jgi:streptomycin 6-kinase
MAGVTIVLPSGLDEQRGLGPDWGRWLDRLPRLFTETLEEWGLRRDGDDLWHGFCSLVAPVVTQDGERAVLKVSFDGDDESVHEGLALQHWHGDGVVRLLRADPRRRALLLERLPLPPNPPAGDPAAGHGHVVRRPVAGRPGGPAARHPGPAPDGRAGAVAGA